MIAQPFVETWAVADDLPPVKILDTSRHNHGTAQVPIDFAQVKAAGYTIWCGRASVGNYYIDPWFQEDYDAAKAAGLICLAYHVTVPINDDASQLENFLQALGGRKPAGVVIDAEWNVTPSTPARCTACVQNHVDAFQNLDWQPRVLIYTNQNYGNNYLLSDFGLPLWVASPGAGGSMNPALRPSLPRWWTDYFMWQRSWTEAIPGVPDTTVDYSEWNGINTPEGYFAQEEEEPPMTDPELLARIIALEARVTALEGGATPPPPVTPPPAPDDTIVIIADPRANARFASSTNNKGKPVMEIYPKDTAPTADRIQFTKGTELAVVLPMVTADGGMKYYQLRDRKGRAGETLYVREVDAILA